MRLLPVMMRLPPVIEVDLLIEHDGRHLTVRGSGRNFVAKFPSLPSLFHFARIFWAHRTEAPIDAIVQIAWRRLSIPVKLHRYSS